MNVVITFVATIYYGKPQKVMITYLALLLHDGLSQQINSSEHVTVFMMLTLLSECAIAVQEM